MLFRYGQKAAPGDSLFVLADQVSYPTGTAFHRGTDGSRSNLCHRHSALERFGVVSCCPLDFAIGELAVASGLLAGAAPVEPNSTVYSAT